MTEEVLRTRSQDTEEHWISISDMMAGLMVIFLFIAISYMLHVRADKERIEKIAVTYEALQGDLREDLANEFKNDFNNWNAVLNRQTLSIRFEEPEVLFLIDKSEIRPVFKKILREFFPRYIKILTDTKNDAGEYKYRDDIAEIRIEGHTSSEWNDDTSSREAYILNMGLSQERTRSVLEFVLQINRPEIRQHREWITKHLTANGLSSSRLIKNRDGTENPKESRRVEFRVRTNAEKRIVEIIKRGEQG